MMDDKIPMSKLVDIAKGYETSTHFLGQATDLMRQATAMQIQAERCNGWVKNDGPGYSFRLGLWLKYLFVGRSKGEELRRRAKQLHDEGIRLQAEATRLAEQLDKMTKTLTEQLDKMTTTTEN